MRRHQREARLITYEPEPSPGASTWSSVASIRRLAPQQRAIISHRAGVTDVPLQAHEERRLLDYGCGITAVVGRPTRRADEVSLEEFKAAPSRIQSQDSALCPALER